MSKSKTSSKVMLIISMLVFGTVGIFRRLIPLSSAMLAFCRGIIGSLFLIAFVKFRGQKIFHNIGVKKYIGLVVSGALIGFNWILLFEAYNHTTIATATLCYYMAPTIVIILSPFVLKEKLTAKKGICAAISVVGMAFVAGIVESGIPKATEAKGVLFGLGAAVLYASVVTINKFLPGIDAYEKTIIQLMSAAVALVPYLIITGEFKEVAFAPSTIALVAVVGLVHTGISYAMYFGSMDAIEAQTVAIFSYIDPVTALILSGLLLHESMSIYEIIGMILILGATAGSEIRR